MLLIPSRCLWANSISSRARRCSDLSIPILKSTHDSAVVLTEFFARRWRGQVPTGTVFWRDMIVVGSAVNVLATFAALMLAAQGVALAIAVAVHFAPLPYNIFLLAAVGRSPQRTPVISALAGVWIVLAVLL